MKRRAFIKSGLLFVPTLLLPRKTLGQFASFNDQAFLSQASLLDLPQLASLWEAWESSTFDGQSNGTTISSWAGRNGLTAVTGTSPRGHCVLSAPTVDTSVKLGGHNTVKFLSGSSQGLAAPNTFPGTASIVTGAELVVILQSDVTGTPQNFQGGAGPGSDQQYFPFSDNNIYCAFCRTDRPSMGGNSTSWTTQFNVLEFSAKKDGSAYDAWINKANHVYTSGSFTFNGGDGEQPSFGMQDNTVSCSFTSCHIAAVYLWSTYFSASDRTQLYNYINNKWGLSL
jgi:hypothetical protein